MGLAGVLVSTPAVDNGTPYSNPTPAVKALFRDLGTTEAFPGERWKPDRTWIWVFSAVDPTKHALVASAGPGATVAPSAFLSGYEPQYFMINGKSGFFSSHDQTIAPQGRIGQPALIRVATVGLVTNAPHIHGHHVHVQTGEGPHHDGLPIRLDTWRMRIHDNVIAVDTWGVRPLQTVDVLLPFIAPPDAYPWPPSDPGVFTADLAGDGSHGMVFPMHCHTEMSQTAAGGNYPQGLITHWTITGDLDS
jgi:hypothetical protein